MARVLFVGKQPPEAVLAGVDLEVVDSLEAARLSIESESPEVLLADLQSSSAQLEDLIEHARQHRVPVILLAPEENRRSLALALESGAAGLLRMPFQVEALNEAIGVVRAGGSYLGNEAASTLQTLLTERIDAHRSGEVSLSVREEEVLETMVSGKSARQAAKHLGVSERTINTHVAAVFRKLGVKSRAEAIREAARRGLIESP